MAANGCAHDRFHENSRQETVCLDCGLPLEEVLQEWLAALRRRDKMEIIDFGCSMVGRRSRVDMHLRRCGRRRRAERALRRILPSAGFNRR